MPDQNLLLDALNSSALAQNAAKKQEDTLTRILSSMGLLNEQSQETITRASEAASTVEQQALLGAQQAQEAAQQFAREAGSDIRSPENILISLGQELRANLTRAQQARQNIDTKQSINIIDNPLAWLHGQMTIGQDQQVYTGSMQSAEGISQNISTLTAATDQVGRTQAALATKITDATRAAAAEARRLEAEQSKQAALRNHLKEEMVIAGAIQGASSAQSMEVQRQLGIVTSEEQRAMEQERFAMYKQQFAWEQQSKELSRRSKKDQDSVKEQLLMQYNIGARVLGLPEETNMDLVLARAELGGTDATRVSAAMEAGGNTLAAGGSARVAASPAAAANMIAKGVYVRSADPGFDPMKQYLRDTAAAKAALGAKPEETAGYINAQVKVDAENFKKNAVATGSFYAPPPLQSIINTESVKRTALYQKVLATSGKDLTTAAPTPIVNLAFEAAKQGVISYEEAAKGLNELYGKAAEINNSQKRFTQIGVPAQTSFNVEIVGINANLMDYSSTLRLLAVKRARETVGLGLASMIDTAVGKRVVPDETGYYKSK